MDGARGADVAEIEAALRDALALHGVAGEVVVRGTEIELRGNGSVPVSVDADAIVKQWGLLPPAMRQRKVTDLARRLGAALRATTGGSDSPETPTRGPRADRPFVASLGGIAVIGALGVGAWFGLGLGDHGAHSAASADPYAPETSAQTTARRARACEAARRRMYSGAPMGPFVPEGWVVELWLARWAGDDLAQNAAITGLIDGTKLSRAADADISALADGVFTIEQGIPEDGEPSAAGHAGVTLRFSGLYANAFFDPMMRPRFLALADRTAASVSADAGALYARCENLRFHDVGAWFLGADPATAAAAMVYGVGAFAASPTIDRGALEKFGSAGELESLRKAAGKLDVATLAADVGLQGGSITTGDAGMRVIIAFPILGGSRAVVASSSLARRMGVGVGTN